MKPKNTICLWFDKDAHDAARFYAAATSQWISLTQRACESTGSPDSLVTSFMRAPGVGTGACRSIDG